MNRKIVKKSHEELHEELIQKLIQEREYHEPTLSYLAKLSNVNLPIVCLKCRNKKHFYENDKQESFKSESDINFESSSTASKFFSSSSLSLFSPSENDEFDKRLCIFYKKKISNESNKDTNEGKGLSNFLERLTLKSAPEKSLLRENSLFESRSLGSFASTRKSKVAFDLPLSAKSRKSASNSNIKARIQLKKTKIDKTKNNGEQKMIEGETRYTYTSNGLEIKRLISKNWLTVDILKADVCKDQNEKQQIEWVKRQREEEEERMKQNFPSQTYEKKLKEIKKNIKKGALPYEVWARQNYEIKLLEEQIRSAKRRESRIQQIHIKRLMEQDKLNLNQLKKIKS